MGSIRQSEESICQTVIHCPEHCHHIHMMGRQLCGWCAVQSLMLPHNYFTRVCVHVCEHSRILLCWLHISGCQLCLHILPCLARTQRLQRRHDHDRRGIPWGQVAGEIIKSKRCTAGMKLRQDSVRVHVPLAPSHNQEAMCTLIMMKVGMLYVRTFVAMQDSIGLNALGGAPIGSVQHPILHPEALTRALLG